MCVVLNALTESKSSCVFPLSLLIHLLYKALCVTQQRKAVLRKKEEMNRGLMLPHFIYYPYDVSYIYCSISSHSSQCSTTGVTKAVICVILSVG